MNREPMLIARSKSPTVLGDHAQTIRLESADGASIVSEAASLNPEQHIYLVFRNITVERQPGILYRIYLDLPAAAVEQHAPDYYVGAINFFGFVTRPARSGSNKGSSRFRSYDITGLVVDLARKGVLSVNPTVTIVPVGKPEPESHPTLGNIEIVVQ
jgi:tyrosinase